MDQHTTLTCNCLPMHCRQRLLWSWNDKPLPRQHSLALLTLTSLPPHPVALWHDWICAEPVGRHQVRMTGHNYSDYNCMGQTCMSPKSALSRFTLYNVQSCNRRNVHRKLAIVEILPKLQDNINRNSEYNIFSKVEKQNIQWKVWVRCYIIAPTSTISPWVQLSVVETVHCVPPQSWQVFVQWLASATHTMIWQVSLANPQQNN